MVLSIILIVLVFALILLLVVPELADCITMLIDKIPGAIESATVWVQESGILNTEAAEELWASIAEVDWQAKISQMVGIFLDGLGGAAQVAVNAVGSMVSIIGSLVIGIVLAIVLLSGGEAPDEPTEPPTTGNVFYSPRNVNFESGKVYISLTHVYYEDDSWRSYGKIRCRRVRARSKEQAMQKFQEKYGIKPLRAE